MRAIKKSLSLDNLVTSISSTFTLGIPNPFVEHLLAKIAQKAGGSFARNGDYLVGNVSKSEEVCPYSEDSSGLPGMVWGNASHQARKQNFYLGEHCISIRLPYIKADEGEGGLACDPIVAKLTRGVEDWVKDNQRSSKFDPDGNLADLGLLAKKLHELTDALERAGTDRDTVLAVKLGIDSIQELCSGRGLELVGRNYTSRPTPLLKEKQRDQVRSTFCSESFEFLDGRKDNLIWTGSDQVEGFRLRIEGYLFNICGRESEKELQPAAHLKNVKDLEKIKEEIDSFLGVLDKGNFDEHMAVKIRKQLMNLTSELPARVRYEESEYWRNFVGGK